MTEEERPIEVAEPEADLKAAIEDLQWEATEVPQMTEDELRTLAQQVVTNLAFLTNKEPGIGSFHLILAMSLPKMKESFVADIGGVWELYAKAAPRSMNGLPVFTSMHLVSNRDWDQLMDFIREYEAALGLPVMPGEHGES